MKTFPASAPISCAVLVGPRPALSRLLWPLLASSIVLAPQASFAQSINDTAILLHPASPVSPFGDASVGDKERQWARQLLNWTVRYDANGAPKVSGPVVLACDQAPDLPVRGVNSGTQDLLKKATAVCADPVVADAVRRFRAR